MAEGNTGVMCFHATVQPGEAVYQSHTCILVPNAHHLVLNKGNRIEAYTIGGNDCENGTKMSLLASFMVPGWATVIAVDRTTDEASMTDEQYVDSIVILTKANRLFCVQFNAQSNQLEMIGQADLSETASRPPKRPILLLRDGIAICHVSMGVLKVVNVRNFPKTGRHLTKAVTIVRISDLSIQDAVLCGSRLLVLTRRASQETVIKHYLIPEHQRTGSATNKTAVLDDTLGELQLDVASPGYRVIPYSDSPRDDNGYLILTIDHILYHNAARAIKIGRTVGSVVFEAVAGVEPGRFVAIDCDGMLYSVQVDGQRAEVQVDRLGRTGRGNSLSYLGDGLLFVGSETGDSLTLQLLDAPDANTKQYFTVIATHHSMSPINSAVLCDLDGTGRPVMVAGCGENRNGNITLLSKGISLNCQQETDFPVDISDIDFFMHRGKQYLTVRLIEESYIFGLTDQQELEESSERFIPSGESILLTKNVYNGPLMVITGRRVSLYREGERKSMAFPEPPCIMATVSHDLIACVMLSTPNAVLVYQCSSAVGAELSIKPFAMVNDLPGQVSAVDIRKADDGTAILAVAFWAKPAVVVYKVTRTEAVVVCRCECKEAAGTIVSVLVCHLSDTDWAVFVASVVGAVGCLKLTLQPESGGSGGSGELSGSGATFKLLSSASTRPVRLFKHSRDTVFATGDHPMFVKMDPRTFITDTLPVDTPDISAFTHLGDVDRRVVAVASRNRLMVGRLGRGAVEGERRCVRGNRLRDLDVPVSGESGQIHQLLRHEYPISIAVGLKALAACTSDRPPSHINNLAYQPLGRLLLFNKKSLTISDSIECNTTEFPLCAVFAKLEGCTEQMLFVGTKSGSKSKFEASEGRVSAYTVSDGGKAALQCEAAVDGAVVTMVEFQGKLAVSVQGKVILFKYKHTPKPTLNPITDFYGQIFIESMATHTDNKANGVLAMGDHIKSVVLAKPAIINSEPTMVEVSRNVEAHSITTLCMLDGKRVLAGDANGNIMAMSQSQNPVYNDTRFQTLDITGGIYVGPTVTGLMAGHIGDIDCNLLAQPVLYTTRSGSVGLIAQFTEASVFEALLKVQDRLRTPEERDARKFAGKLGKPELVMDMVDGDALFRLFQLPEPLSLLSGCDIAPERLFSVIESLYNSV